MHDDKAVLGLSLTILALPTASSIAESQPQSLEMYPRFVRVLLAVSCAPDLTDTITVSFCVKFFNITQPNCVRILKNLKILDRI